jgi:hypothetical protein
MVLLHQSNYEDNQFPVPSDASALVGTPFPSGAAFLRLVDASAIAVEHSAAIPSCVRQDNPWEAAGVSELQDFQAGAAFPFQVASSHLSPYPLFLLQDSNLVVRKVSVEW